MDIDLASGRYVVAVSGGIDSMVLLDVLVKRPDLSLIVAHFDHGIRDESDKDRKLVQEIAKKHGLQFVYDEGELGSDASESEARNARYEFLHKVRSNSGARAVVTAHHQDDLLETVIMNLIRGTGRSGLSPLFTTDNIQRPLLGFTKEQITEYANQNNLIWHEDSTNSDTKYLRNYIRHEIIPKLNTPQKQQLLNHINNAKPINEDINNIITGMLHVQPSLNTVDRHWFIMLPHTIASEVMKAWLEKHKVKDVNRKQIQRLVIVAKISPPNRIADIDKKFVLSIKADELKIVRREAIA
jgi:tRNA(Ile)-lysidine synthase